MDRAVYERMAEIDGEHWWFVGRRAIVAALIERYAPKARPLRILEVGCGTGSNIAMLGHFGRVDAIEPDDGARAVATARSGVGIKGGYLPDAADTFEDGAYDLIVLLDVLEHISGDTAALTALGPKLKPGGKLILTVPAAPWMWSAHDVAHHHQRRYTARTLEQVLGNSGFRPVHRGHFNTLLFPAVAAARALGRVTRRSGGDDAMPGGLVNRLLAGVFGAERYWIGRVSLPFGVSLAAVAEPVTR